MKNDPEIVMPIQRLISFHKLLEFYDEKALSGNAFEKLKAKRVLDAVAPYPELRDGFEDVALVKKHEKVIRIILDDTFTEVLSKNEIKTASLPYDNFIFNTSERFQKILENAGPNFEPKIRNQEEDFNYMMAAIVVLNFYYGFKLDFSRPYFYDIPDANGVIHHYRILYNADFLDIIPTDTVKELNQDDVNELLENWDNIDLWKEKIPPNSFISKGFVISNMFEHDMESFILQDKDLESCQEALCDGSYQKLLGETDYFTIPDVEKYYRISEGGAPYKSLHDQGIKSAIFAPIATNEELLGVLEIVSDKVHVLNSVNATKLDDVMPYIVSAVLRSKIEEENLIDAIIQNECTSVHSSVYWRFQEEAKRFIVDDLNGKQPSFREIAFKDVYPLYGQIDIKDSSRARNTAIQNDLMIQLSDIKNILELAWKKTKLPIYEELIFQVNNQIDEVKEVLYTHTEQAIFDFVKEEVKPVFKHLETLDDSLKVVIDDYNSTIDQNTESYYDHRKNYDESVMQINKELAAVIDKKQVKAQKMFPHFFERFKTDGVEHNMYIGDSIVGDRNFNPLYLNNLRLWQLQVMCEMETAYYNLKPELPVQLDVASLILVYNTSLSIRFRMDEKQFDVDGTYNARYEIIKKRIDKSFIKGTKERLTDKGKLAIVYSQKKDELEYLRYIKFLKSKGYFTNKIEIVELEGLQGVSGLKAIRAEILYKKGQETEKTYTYQDLMDELKA